MLLENSPTSNQSAAGALLVDDLSPDTVTPTSGIDPTKEALLPLQSTSFANVTNYARGLNGLVVDVANLPGLPSVSDIEFATWNGIDADWVCG